MITPEILQRFKDKMHIDGDEDGNLMRILNSSVIALIDECGDYDIETDKVFEELVFNRARYEYNDALEYFDKNFLRQINSLGMKKALEEMSDADATV